MEAENLEEGVDGNTLLKQLLNKRGRGLDSTGLEYGPMVGYFE
jgi:hypothetical protein